MYSLETFTLCESTLTNATENNYMNQSGPPLTTGSICLPTVDNIPPVVVPVSSFGVTWGVNIISSCKILDTTATCAWGSSGNDGDICGHFGSGEPLVNPRNVYDEQQIKRWLKRIHKSECRFNERLKAKTDGSTRLTDTGLTGDLEHLTLETHLGWG